MGTLGKLRGAVFCETDRHFLGTTLCSPPHAPSLPNQSDWRDESQTCCLEVSLPNSPGHRGRCSGKSARKGKPAWQKLRLFTRL